MKVEELKSDVKINVESYYIEDFKTINKPEGHYLHSSVKLNPVHHQLQYYSGDFVIYTKKPSNRYPIETLESHATDSYFNWNFFDSILNQKEHYSAYVFEDTAAELLKHNPELKTKMEAKKASDADFTKNGTAQFDFIYKNSDYYEKTRNRYSVARLMIKIKLDLK